LLYTPAKEESPFIDSIKLSETAGAFTMNVNGHIKHEETEL
jgi:hypothetical protein